MRKYASICALALRTRSANVRRSKPVRLTMAAMKAASADGADAESAVDGDGDVDKVGEANKGSLVPALELLLLEIGEADDALAEDAAEDAVEAAEDGGEANGEGSVIFQMLASIGAGDKRNDECAQSSRRYLPNAVRCVGDKRTVMLSGGFDAALIDWSPSVSR